MPNSSNKFLFTYTVFAQDDDTESTSPVIWVLFSLLFLIVGAMVIGMLFIVYHFHQRFKKIGKHLTLQFREEKFHHIVSCFCRNSIFKTGFDFIRVSCGYEYQHIVIGSVNDY